MEAVDNLRISLPTFSKAEQGRGGNSIPALSRFETKRTEGQDMDLIRRAYVKAAEMGRGQTMAEYALILAAVAVVAYVGYSLMGTTITTMLTTIDGKL
jgi:Flp pilus assembly pilin Flp